MKRISVLLSACLILLISTRTLPAADISVPTNYPTIQGAINAAQVGDVVMVAAGTYPENIVMKEGVTLRGGYSSGFSARDISLNLTVIDGGQNGPAVLFEDINTATIDGFKITNGYNPLGGGIRCYYSNPTIINNTITGNEATEYGGGIYCNNSFPTISNNTITDNEAQEYGGGIYCYESSPQISSNTITENHASTYGGGIDCSSSYPTIINNTITGNETQEYGGGISCYESSPEISSNTISANHASLYGGGIYCNNSFPTISNNTITGNEATEYGGGISCYESSPQISSNTISENYASFYGGGINSGSNSYPTIVNNTITGNETQEYGGGISCYESSPEISSNTISENQAHLRGGGIYCYYSNSAIANNTITGNEATEHGAGIYCFSSGSIISGNAIIQNQASAYGGGISCVDSNPEISNNVISGNHAILYGSAIYCSNSAPEIRNCTIVRNTAVECGALFIFNSSSPQILNTIFWQNNDDLIYEFSSTPTVSYSNISDSRYSGQNGNISLDPLLLDLEAGDYRLNPGSPCVNTGNPSPQYNDPDGSINDMGAFGGPGAAGEQIPMIPVPYKEDSPWEDLGLYGGQILSLVIDPANNSKMFAASYKGDGLFVTTDGGVNWQTVEGFRSKECFQVAIDPPNSNRVWVAHSYFIALSNDGGESWSKWRLSNDRFAHSVVIDPTNSNTVYVGVGGESSSNLNGTVFKTTDGGTTWQQSNFVSDKTITYMAINPSNPNVVWALTGYNETGSVYKSVDGGVNWTKIIIPYTDVYVNEVVIHPENQSTAYISGSFGVVKTTDNGANWGNIGITEPCKVLALYPQNPDILYAATNYKGAGNYFFKSINGGNTWEEYPIGYNCFFCLTINPQTPNILYGGDLNLGVFKSLDAGVTWSAINNGIKANIVYDSAVDPNNPDILLAGTIAGLFKRNPNGAWTQLAHQTVKSIAYNPADSNTIYVGQEYTLTKTTNYGNTWEEIYISQSSDAHQVSSIAVDPQNTNILYLGIDYVRGHMGEIYKSVNGGETFSPKRVFDVPVNTVTIDPANSQVLYAGTGMFFASSYEQQGGIYKSIDGGENWFGPLLADVVVNSIIIDPSNHNVIYAGCGEGGNDYRGFYKSVNGGQTWENKEFVLGAVTDVKINPGRTNTLYAATYRQGVYMSIDAGENWVNIGLAEYVMFDLSIYESGLSTFATSSMRGSFAQESSVNLYAGTNSGIAGFTGSSISGYIYNNTGSETLYPADVWLDVVTGQINASVFDTGTYLILLPPVGDNYTLHCSAEGCSEGQIPGITVGAMSELYYDFYLNTSSNLLYFPHSDTTNGWGTEIAAINTSSTQTASGTLNGYSDQGLLIETIPISLSPHARRQITISQEFTNHGSISYLIFDSDIDTIQGYSKLYKQGIYRVAVPAAHEANTGDIYISHIASDDDWWTMISLVNTTDTEKTITLTFSTEETLTRTIPPNGSNTFTISELFGQTKPDIKSAVITNANGIVGLELFGSREGSTYNYLSGILLKDDTATTIYYPHIDSNALDPESYWWTGIVAYSPPEYSSDITVTAYKKEGDFLGTINPPTIGPNDKYIGSVADLALPYGTAWIKIDSNNPITGFELFGTHNGNQLAGYTGVNISGKEGVFAKIEKQGWTGIAFVNIEDSQASIELTAYDNYGNTIATKEVTLASYAKQVEQPMNIFTQDISSATYISYSSDKDIVAFQLNGASDGMMLDGLEGM